MPVRAFSILVLASLLLVPVAWAGPCVPSCEVMSAPIAFVPPATVVTSGATVTWSATDGSAHTATGPDGCFHVAYGRAKDASATFTLVDGGVSVTTSQGRTSFCAGTPLEGGAVLLSYVCIYHPSMYANLVIIPG